jgi:hypothetical protein
MLLVANESRGQLALRLLVGLFLQAGRHSPEGVERLLKEPSSVGDELLDLLELIVR